MCFACTRYDPELEQSLEGDLEPGHMLHAGSTRQAHASGVVPARRQAAAPASDKENSSAGTACRLHLQAFCILLEGWTESSLVLKVHLRMILREMTALALRSVCCPQQSAE